MSDSINENLKHQARQAVGLQVLTARTAKNLTREELAQSLEIEPSTISKIEAGKFNLGIDLLSRICDKLDAELTLKPKWKKSHYQYS